MIGSEDWGVEAASMADCAAGRGGDMTAPSERRVYPRPQADTGGVLRVVCRAHRYAPGATPDFPRWCRVCGEREP